MVWLPSAKFRVFGFIDCTDVQMCRPSADKSITFSPEALQRILYSNYFKAHRVKFQVLVFLYGMISSIFGCSIWHNNNGILNMSDICSYLMNIITPMISMISSLIFTALYGDDIYVPTIQITWDEA